MKHARGLPPFDQAAMDAALAAAPDRVVENAGLPYEPNDAAAVAGFYKDAVRSQSLPELRSQPAERRRTREDAKGMAQKRRNGVHRAVASGSSHHS